MKYEFKTQPFDHQKDVLQESWAESHYALFMEMGTGKSKVVVDNMAVLNQTGQINAALIIAPKGVFDNWVMQEIPTHMPDKVSVQVLRWQRRADVDVTDTSRHAKKAQEARGHRKEAARETP